MDCFQLIIIFHNYYYYNIINVHCLISDKSLEIQLNLLNRLNWTKFVSQLSIEHTSSVQKRHVGTKCFTNHHFLTELKNNYVVLLTIKNFGEEVNDFRFYGVNDSRIYIVFIYIKYLFLLQRVDFK